MQSVRGKRCFFKVLYYEMWLQLRERERERESNYILDNTIK